MATHTDLGTLLRSAFQADGINQQDIASPRSELKPGERRNTAVLFLDLAGFTALSGKLDHETVHDITGSIMDQLVATAGEFSGYVDKIEGDRIMVLFGALQSAENDSRRAVHCGFRMLDVLELAGSVLSSMDVRISARIGIGSGPVTVAPDSIGHLTAMGNTVNMASRMEQLAEHGSILVTDRVHSLCTDCALWEGPLTLQVKGVTEPVRAWVPTAPLRQERPHRHETVFAGREKELSQLKALLESTGEPAPDGLPKHLFVEITGDAGTGKARLAGEFIRRECPDHLVLRGRAVPHGQPAYWLWSSVVCSLLGFTVQKPVSWDEFISALSRLTDPSEIESALPFIGRLIPAHTDDRRLTSLGRQALALEMKLAVRDLLQALSMNRPLVIQLDDTQWMDTTDAKVLSFLIENCRSSHPLILILTGRDSGPDSPAAPFRKKSFYSSHTSIQIDELSREACGTLASSMADWLTGKGIHDFADHSLELLWNHSSGNPFFLRELVTHLMESDMIKLQGTVWWVRDYSVQHSSPESLSSLLQSRVDNLPDKLKSTLLLCSVLGREFHYETYRMVSAGIGTDVASFDVFEALVEKQMLTRADSGGMVGFRFRHSLIQRSAYGNNLAHNLKLIHRAAAEAMEILFSHDDTAIAARLATHWEGAGDIGKASCWGVLAQEHAADNYQHGAVLFWGEKLTEWLPPGTDAYMKVLERNASAYLFTGRSNEHLESLEKIVHMAEKAGDLKWMTRGHMNLGAQCRAAGHMDKALEQLNRAHEICIREGFRELEANTLGNLGVLSADLRDAEGAMNFFSRARILHSELGNLKGEANTLGNLGILLRNLGRPDEAISHLSDALKLFREMGDSRNEAITTGNIGNIYHDLKEYDTAGEHYRSAVEIFTRIGDRRSKGVFQGNLGIIHFDKGEDETAEDYFNKALAVSLETGNPRSRGWTLSNLSLLRIRQGRLEEASDTCGEALALFRKIGDGRLEASSMAALAYIEFKSGNTDASIDAYLNTVEKISSMKLPPRDFTQTLVRHRAELLESTGRQLPLPDHWGQEL